MITRYGKFFVIKNRKVVLNPRAFSSKSEFSSLKVWLSLWR